MVVPEARSRPRAARTTRLAAACPHAWTDIGSDSLRSDSSLFNLSQSESVVIMKSCFDC